MWLMINDAFLSIVKKDCKTDELLVRARRAGDIERVFGRGVRVVRSLDSDYLYRSVIKRDRVIEAIQCEVLRIDYGNFKDSVDDKPLHDAYLRVWTAMASLQHPGPYSAYGNAQWANWYETPKHDIKAQVEVLGADSLLPPEKNSKRKKRVGKNGTANGAASKGEKNA